MMKSVKFSIITAVYNRANVIEQAISSVVNQTYDNYEYIVVDGGSLDGTVEILKKYSSKIRWVSEFDEGIYDAWNKGVKMATGDYILFMGSDDCLLDRNVLSNAAVYTTKYPDADFLCGGIVVVNEKTKVEQIVRDNMGKISTNIPLFLPTQGMLIKTSVAKKYLFDTSFRIAADTYFYRQCYYQYNLKFQICDFLTEYFSDGGISSYTHTERYKTEVERCLKPFGFSSQKTTLWGKCKLAVWYVLDILGLKEKVHTMLHGHVYRKHHCTNKICRWCGRYETDSK